MLAVRCPGDRDAGLGRRSRGVDETVDVLDAARRHDVLDDSVGDVELVLAVCAQPDRDGRDASIAGTGKTVVLEGHGHAEVAGRGKGDVPVGVRKQLAGCLPATLTDRLDV